MFKPILDYTKEKPRLYAQSTAPFWDDEHISKGMLDAHLNLNIESASRKYEYIIKSAAWISEEFLQDSKNRLLDLGCGPGLYSELFSKAKFDVTGIDFSKRSIAYATKSALSKKLPIKYIYDNYLTVDLDNQYDIFTLIYCDFGVLSPTDRKTLLTKIKRAMKDDAVLILDTWTANQFNDFTESRTIQYHNQGYWSPKPHLCIQSNYIYPETNNYLEQYIIVTENNCECYNIWNQSFSMQSLKQELIDAGFKDIDFYDNTAGKAYTGKYNTICAITR